MKHFHLVLMLGAGGLAVCWLATGWLRFGCWQASGSHHTNPGGSDIWGLRAGGVSTFPASGQLPREAHQTQAGAKSGADMREA